MLHVSPFLLDSRITTLATTIDSCRISMRMIMRKKIDEEEDELDEL